MRGNSRFFPFHSCTSFGASKFYFEEFDGPHAENFICEIMEGYFGNQLPTKESMTTFIIHIIKNKIFNVRKTQRFAFEQLL